MQKYNTSFPVWVVVAVYLKFVTDVILSERDFEESIMLITNTIIQENM